MSQVSARVNDNGPIKVEGPITLVDGEGKSLEIAGDKPVFLCRCGASAKKPFCDGAHKSCGFASAVRAADL
jgi:CDGSH-type Zn-finger protein